MEHPMMEYPMKIEDVALSVYASLIQKLHTYGSDDSDRRKLAVQSFQYADAFLAALDARNSAKSVAKSA
jgi:hypothetical protein